MSETENDTPTLDPAAKAEAEALYKKLTEIVSMYRPEDMSTEKILGRMPVIGMLGGTTRTTALGAAVFAGLNGPMTGLSKDQVVEIVSQVYDAVAASPKTPEIAAKYAEINEESKKAMGNDGPQVLSPGSKMVH